MWRSKKYRDIWVCAAGYRAVRVAFHHHGVWAPPEAGGRVGSRETKESKV
jgi:hypothetical protein